MEVVFTNCIAVLIDSSMERKQNWTEDLLLLRNRLGRALSDGDDCKKEIINPIVLDCEVENKYVTICVENLIMSHIKSADQLYDVIESLACFVKNGVKLIQSAHEPDRPFGWSDLRTLGNGVMCQKVAKTIFSQMGFIEDSTNEHQPLSARDFVALLTDLVIAKKELESYLERTHPQPNNVERFLSDEAVKSVELLHSNNREENQQYNCDFAVPEDLDSDHGQMDDFATVFTPDEDAASIPKQKIDYTSLMQCDLKNCKAVYLFVDSVISTLLRGKNWTKIAEFFEDSASEQRKLYVVKCINDEAIFKKVYNRLPETNTEEYSESNVQSPLKGNFYQIGKKNTIHMTTRLEHDLVLSQEGPSNSANITVEPPAEGGHLKITISCKDKNVEKCYFDSVTKNKEKINLRMKNLQTEIVAIEKGSIVLHLKTQPMDTIDDSLTKKLVKILECLFHEDCLSDCADQMPLELFVEVKLNLFQKSISSNAKVTQTELAGVDKIIVTREKRKDVSFLDATSDSEYEKTTTSTLVQISGRTKVKPPDVRYTRKHLMSYDKTEQAEQTNIGELQINSGKPDILSVVKQYVCQRITNIADVCLNLYDRHVLSKKKTERILGKCYGMTNKAGCLFEMIEDQGVNALGMFFFALEECGNEDIAEILWPIYYTLYWPGQRERSAKAAEEELLKMKICKQKERIELESLVQLAFSNERKPPTFYDED